MKKSSLFLSIILMCATLSACSLEKLTELTQKESSKETSKGSSVVSAVPEKSEQSSENKNISNDEQGLILTNIKLIDPYTETEYQKNLAELTETLDLADILKTPARQLSLGQRMRCEIAASLLHDPKILFLDEPTIGLDVVSKRSVRDFIKKRNEEKGTTIILTTHDTLDLEALTERILLIGKGRILLDGRLEDLKQQYAEGSNLEDVVVRLYEEYHL